MAMAQAVRTAVNAQSSGDCGRIMIVLLTDGRANVSLGRSNEDPEVRCLLAFVPFQAPAHMQAPHGRPKQAEACPACMHCAACSASACLSAM